MSDDPPDVLDLSDLVAFTDRLVDEAECILKWDEDLHQLIEDARRLGITTTELEYLRDCAAAEVEAHGESGSYLPAYPDPSLYGIRADIAPATTHCPPATTDPISPTPTSRDRAQWSTGSTD